MQIADICPTCEQPITAAIRERIQEKARRREAAHRKEIEVSMRSDAQQQHQRDLTAFKKQLENKHLQELAAQKAQLDKQWKQARINDSALVQKQRQAYQRKILELERQVQKKTPNELGDGPEQDLFGVLRQAFPEDAIQRVGKGDPGADVIEEVRYRGDSCGSIIFDSKNCQSWSNQFLTKLRTDKSRVGATHAVLVSVTSPRGQGEFYKDDDVIVIHPKGVVYVVELLRRSMIELHRQGLSLKERNTKMADLYRYLSSRDFAQRLAEATRLIKDLRNIDQRERDTHEKRWGERERFLIRMKVATDDVNNRVTSILEGTGEPTGLSVAS